MQVEVSGRSIDFRAGVLPPMLQLLFGMLVGDSGWILGADFFGDRAILLDYAAGRIIELSGS
ncbi:MAG: hypothetical protein H0X01_01530 [Nitrospira sp.]|nr:hypothetical protein [Nitrospira sp.]